MTFVLLDRLRRLVARFHLSCPIGWAACLAILGLGGASLATAEEPSFRHEIVPLLTRLGCNQGSCHGKLAGQNGFRLSLRGYALDWDHQWLTREFDGRRINRVQPEQSLLLTKPLLQTPHAGGRLFEEGSRAHQTLLAWIQAGTPGPINGEATLERLEIQAGDSALGVGEERALTVTAHFSDGSARDVTWLCLFYSNDESVLEVSREGRIRSLRPGEAAVRVHYQELVEVVSFSTRYSHSVDPELYRERHNVVDEAVFAKLEALQIPPSPLCDDATFLRRAYLDTIGTLPTPEEVRAFLADDTSDKRSRFVEELLNRPEFVDY